MVQVIVFDVDGDGTILDSFQSGTVTDDKELEYTTCLVHLDGLDEFIECDRILVMECKEA